VVVGVGAGLGVALVARGEEKLVAFAHQDRSAWTHEVDVRPFKEKF